MAECLPAQRSELCQYLRPPFQNLPTTHTPHCDNESECENVSVRRGGHGYELLRNNRRNHMLLIKPQIAPEIPLLKVPTTNQL